MRFKAGVVLFFCYAAACLPVCATEHQETVLVLTAVENGLEPQQNFTCYGKIHGYIRLPKRESGVHSLEGRWIAPNGKVAADSQNTVDFKPARSTAYVWFAFPENASLLGTPDPDLEQDRLSFNGLWHVEVRWDEQPLIRKEFQVHCP